MQTYTEPTADICITQRKGDLANVITSYSTKKNITSHKTLGKQTTTWQHPLTVVTERKNHEHSSMFLSSSSKICSSSSHVRSPAMSTGRAQKKGQAMTFTFFFFLRGVDEDAGEVSSSTFLREVARPPPPITRERGEDDDNMPG